MPFIKQLINRDSVNLTEFQDSLTLGRARTNNVVIDDPTVSQFHAKIVFDKQADGWFIEDCASTNGLLIDGKALARSELLDGMSFTIGAQAFHFSLAEPQDLDKTLRIKKSWIPGIYYTE